MNTNDLTNSETLNNSIEIVGKLLSGLEQLGPLALLFVVALGIGYTVKLLPWCENYIIPTVVIVSSALLNVFLYPTEPLAVKWEYPVIVKVLYGFIVGVGAVASHHLVISRIEDWLERKGKLPRRLQSEEGQTQFLKKHEEKNQ